MTLTPDQINDIATWIALSAAIPFAGYLLTYGLGSPWYRSLLGWVMFQLGLSIVLVLSFNTFRRIHGDFPGFQWWAVGIYSYLTVVGFALWAIVIVERRRAPLLLIPLRKRKDRLMAEKTAEDLAVPDIWYKAKRVLRTALATLISALSVWATIALAAPQVLAELAKILPESWIAWLTVVIAGITAVAGVITRIMAIPAVNAFLTKIGFGSVPKSALIEAKTVAGGKVVEITTVAPDPKAITPPVAVTRPAVD